MEYNYGHGDTIMKRIKKILISVPALFIYICVVVYAAQQTVVSTDTLNQAWTKQNENNTELYSVSGVSDCTEGPCLDGTANSGTIIYLRNPADTFYTALQGGATIANRSWRLPIGAAPGAGLTSYINVDEFGQMGQVASTLLPTLAGDNTFTGSNVLGAQTYTSTVTLPDADGKWRYVSGITGLASKLFSFYSTAVQYVLSYDTLPTVDGSTILYNAGNDDFDWVDIRFKSLAVSDLSDVATPSVLTVAETSNKVISNYKATGADHVFTLPAAHAGGNVIFMVGDEFQVDIEPDTGANFFLNGAAMAADEHIQNTADTLGEQIVGFCSNINGTLTWMFESKYTNFVEETP